MLFRRSPARSHSTVYESPLTGGPSCDPGVTPTEDPIQLKSCNSWYWNSLEGGEGRNRTVDTTIFSRMLYQLSYLATGFAMIAAIYHAAQSPRIDRG